MIYAVLLLAVVPVLAAFIGWAETRETDFTEYTHREYEETWTWPPRS